MTSSARAEAPFGASGGRLRALFWLPLLAPALLLVAGLVSLLATASRRFRAGGFRPIVRAWGRIPLRLLGIRLVVHGREHRDAPGPKLLLFNHVSLLDLFVLAAECPDRPLVLYKREFSRIPGLGRALAAMGMIPVDRSDHESALRSVAQAGERLHAEEAAVMIAPEGTRSRSGGLQAFKLGAFHLAARSQVPIVPVLLRGLDTILPMGSLLARSGTVRLDFLPPISTRDWRPEEARQRAGEVRALFLRDLDPAPDVSSLDGPERGSEAPRAAGPRGE